MPRCEAHAVKTVEYNARVWRTEGRTDGLIDINWYRVQCNFCNV